MKSDTPLDYAVFQLSPKHTRCELLVWAEGETEKIASGLLKPFVTHLTFAEENVAQEAQSIKLEVERRKNMGTWFTKGTLERFVRFVSTPEVLELVNTFDAEMSQLESARRIYSQGAGEQISCALGEGESGASITADTTKKELLRAIDVRLMAVKQDLTVACSRASAAGFTLDNVSELLHFADRFGAHRLNEACSKFISLCQCRPELINLSWNDIDDQNVRSSSDSDMSIDDSTEYNNTTSGKVSVQQQQHHHPKQLDTNLNQSKPATVHLVTSSSISFPLSSVRSNDKNAVRENDRAVVKEKEKVTEPSLLSQQQPARRLSVQDRINLFENKQKEQSGGSGKVLGKSPELRRPTTESCSTSAVLEKAVLRRWSGGSDMSIDLNNDKEAERSSGLTSCSASNSPIQSSNPAISGEDSESKDIGTSQKTQLGRAFSGKGVEITVKDPVGPPDKLRDQPKDKNPWGSETTLGAFSAGGEDIRLRNQAVSLTQSGTSMGGMEQVRLKEQVAPRTPFIDSQSGLNSLCSKVRVVSQKQVSKAFSDQLEDSELGGFQSSSETSARAFPNKVEDVGLKDKLVSQTPGTADNETQRIETNLKDLSSSQIHLKAFVSKTEGIGRKDLLASVPQHRGFLEKLEEVEKYDLEDPKTQWRSCPGDLNQAGKKEVAVFQMQLKDSFSTAVEDLGHQGLKLHRQSSVLDQSEKLQFRRERDASFQGNGEPISSGRKASESREICDPDSIEHVQKAGQSKGNQGLHEELQMKANELEKLFAAHKLRVPGGLVASSRRSKVAHSQTAQLSAADKTPVEPPEKTQSREPSGTQSREPSGSLSSDVDFDVSFKKMVNNQDHNPSKQKLSDLALVEGSRGVFYEKYMQKREAKLKEEWGSKRTQKEAKMKAMQDNLERSRAELKAKFAASEKDLALNARRRVEKMRSFNARVSMKSNEQQLAECLPSEEEEDQLFFSEQSLGDTSSSSTINKRHLHNRSLSSATSRTSIAPVPRSSSKATAHSSSGRRVTAPESPLTQSVLNFSDLRKENTKPATGVSKTSTRSQHRNYGRSKSTSEEINLVKEEKSRRSQSMRKSTMGPVELKDLSSLNTDNVVLTPLKFSEQTEQSLHNKMLKNADSKPYLRKGNGMSAGSAISIAKQKGYIAYKNMNGEEDPEDVFNQPEDSSNFVEVDEEEIEEDFVKVINESSVKDQDFSSNHNNEKPRVNQESEKTGEPLSENGEVLRYLSQVDENSTAGTMTSISSKFSMSAGPIQSPGESPASWMHHSFSYAHETSDIDVSVDSPIGSPASWNSHSLTHLMEADAARMRKKWGSAQKPILVANTSSHQSRKDVKKGFKSLLKFGRKSRGAESLVSDWVSASTASEGDDDTEDGRSPANRSSEDLRKSRMGFSQGLPSYDGFIDGEILDEQVQSLDKSIPVPPSNFKLRDDHISGSSLKAPRSFFSLSSFRSKGSESKPR